VIATTLLTGLVSSARIFGKVWFYLTLWMSGTALLVALALAATGWVLAREHAERLPGPRWLTVETLGALVVTLATAASVVAALRQAPPEQGQGEAVHAVLPDVAAALDPGARYVVYWQEAVVNGSQGYAVLNELERHGFEVGVHPTWRVPATSHRVFPLGSYDREVHVVSGGWIDRWPGIHPESERLLVHDHRDGDERQRFDQLEARVAARLAELGRTDLLDTFEISMFAASLDPTLPADVVADLSEMLLLGEPLAIFLAPPGSTN
jgi:hypothetical protein